MKKSLLALASGAFILGAAEFVMMGILPQTAEAMHVDIPTAGHFISAYAIGVCIGTLILVFGRKIPPKQLIIMFMVIAFVGNALSAFSVNAPMLLAARFISGLPHGAFFGTATLIAKTVADKGKEAQAVSAMVTGQTVANMIGVPAGTLMSEFLSWRLAFIVLSVWAAMTVFLVLAWVPAIAPVKDVGLAGQFRFLRKPGPWLILGAVFTGNAGVFCWWSYVSPWLQKTGGYDSDMVPFLMMLAGFGMVVGGIIGGRITDNWRHAGTAALGQAISGVGLLLVFLVPRQPCERRHLHVLDRVRPVLHLRPTAAADDRIRQGRRRAAGRRGRAGGVQLRQRGRLDGRRRHAELVRHELPLHRIGRRAAGGHRGGAADHILHASRDAHRRAGAYARDHGVSFAGYRLSKLADTSGISLNHRYICEF